MVGNAGRFEDYAAWLSQSYVDIQNRRNCHWRWLRRTFTISTTSGVGTYAFGACTDVIDAAPISRFNSWRINDPEDPPKLFLASSGVGTENRLIWQEWDWFKHLYEIGTQNNGYPAHVTSNPQDKLQLGPKPNGVYTVTGDYWRSPQIMADDSDPNTATPEMPVQFHKLIVYEAMIHYGFQQVANEVLARAERFTSRLTRQLENNQFPKFKQGIPLA